MISVASPTSSSNTCSTSSGTTHHSLSPTTPTLHSLNSPKSPTLHSSQQHTVSVKLLNNINASISPSIDTNDQENDPEIITPSLDTLQYTAKMLEFQQIDCRDSKTQISTGTVIVE